LLCFFVTFFFDSVLRIILLNALVRDGNFVGYSTRDLTFLDRIDLDWIGNGKAIYDATLLDFLLALFFFSTFNNFFRREFEDIG
jgi:hypothetical protein